MLFWLLIAAGFVLWTCLLVLLYRVSWGLTGIRRAVEVAAEQVQSPDLTTLSSTVAELEVKVRELPVVWEEHEHRIKRATERNRYYARQAERGAETGEEQWVGEVPRDDGSGSEANGLQPVPTPLESSPNQQGEVDYIALGWRRKLGMS